MATCRISARPPRSRLDSPPSLTTDPDVIAGVVEDAAHFPGGHASAVAAPRSEAEVAAVVHQASRILPIGAQSSLTGGATPMGDLVLSTARLNHIIEVGAAHVRVQAGVPLAVLQEALARDGLYFPPLPTFLGAFAGGIVATNAAGAATFKYGSTREWVVALTVVLASGDVLDVARGEVSERHGYFEIEGASGVTRVPVPTYRMPDVPKRSAGYFARPAMDLIELFIGSEGTLGIITEITFRVVRRPPALCLALVPATSERQATELAAALRDASLTTWRSGDPRGLDVSAIEYLDRRCIQLLREESADRQTSAPLDADSTVVLLVQLELPAEMTPERAYDEIGDTGSPAAPDTPLGRFCRILQAAGVLDKTEMALPGDRRRADELVALREAVPTAVNQRVDLAKRTIDSGIEKTAADMIVPFSRFSDMLRLFREGFERRNLDHAVWGHISDGNVHPNVLPRSIDDVRKGQETILDVGREVIRMGGCPLAEHGVGRNPVKQALLRALYGDRGLAEMRQVKRALDPAWKLAPGVLFPPE